MTKEIEVVDAVATMDQAGQPKIEGHSIFIVKRTDIGVIVTPALLSLDQQIYEVPNLPAIFTSRAHAIEQISRLIPLVSQQFDELDAQFRTNPSKSEGNVAPKGSEAA